VFEHPSPFFLFPSSQSSFGDINILSPQTGEQDDPEYPELHVRQLTVDNSILHVRQLVI
jgi:hypothetical protein